MTTFEIAGCTALVTGANRGLGRAIALALVAAGAATVYAGARDPRTVTDPGLIPVGLDITDPADVAAAAERCADTNLLVNNAGVMHRSSLLAAPTFDDARADLETNLFGTLSMSRAFAPVLGRNGGGALVNMLSVLSWLPLPQVGGYGVSKAAAWSMTNALREELRGQSTLVVAAHAAFIDTDMAADVDQPKTSPENVARHILDALGSGREEVLVDDLTRHVKAGLSATAGER
ncbi:SDR family oxidoreductase [Streptomyces sp. NPDC058572]|uniref:SDR family oxidoreductase n=1 Tax=Streptomyces sp. NPDC058572 TaxID=3346546 RepID=UPI003658E956